MKKGVFILLVILVIPSVSNAQLIVEESGKVAIGENLMSSNDEPLPLLSDFSINSTGLLSVCMHLMATEKSYGLKVQSSVCDEVPVLLNNGESNSRMPVRSKYGVYSQADPITDGNYYAVYGKSYNQFGNPYGHAYGVYGIAGNGATGFNYGVLGTLHDTNYGAGVYGSSFSNDNGIYINGCFAGYFNGRVCVTDNLKVGSLTYSSDFRLKENIASLPESALNAVDKMNVVQFNYKQREVQTADGTEKLYEEDSDILSHKHYGLIAQELREIYPDLVIEDSEGYLSVNYIELIPILIQSIQELKAELSGEKRSAALRDQNATSVSSATDALQTELFQNTPNPFTEKTTINCTIAKTVSQAMLYVYDMNGKQIAEYPVAERGDAQVVIEGNSLDAGMYMYSLIADGNVIDTKRMILTK